MAGSFPPTDDGKQTLAEHVQQHLREAILTQELEPGDRVDQNQIAEKLEKGKYYRYADAERPAQVPKAPMDSRPLPLDFSQKSIESLSEN